MSILFTLAGRLKQGFMTVPEHFSSGLAISVFAYILFALLFAWRSHFLDWMPSPKSNIIRIMATSFFAPALLEETFFRALLLPHPASDVNSTEYLSWSLISLLLFIVYHPLNGMTAFPQGRKTFSDRRFLILATALGIVCTITYWRTGSIWLPILIHWLTVVVWLLCFGETDKLGFNPSKDRENLG